MNTKSVKLVQMFLISLCAILALMAGVVFSYARAGTHEAMAAVINPNYAQTYIYKHTSTYDTAENKFSDPVSTVVVDEDGNALINNGQYVLLDTPELFTYKLNGETKVYEGEDGYTDIASEPQTELVYYSVHFAVGEKEGYRTKVANITVYLNSDRSIIATKESETTIRENNQTYDIKYRDVFAVTGLDISNHPLAEKANEYLTPYIMSYAITSTNPEKTPITQYKELEGLYTIDCTYNSLPFQTFNFYLLTSNSYAVSKNVKFLNTNTQVKNSDTVTTKNYNTENYFQFSNQQSNSSKIALNYPVFNYNPEKYQIDYTLTQYNYQKSTTLRFAESMEESLSGNDKVETYTATLTENNSYNNGTLPTQNIYKLVYKKTITPADIVTYSDFTYTVNNKNVEGSPVLSYNTTNYNYNVSFTFLTPGLYEFNKTILLDSGYSVINNVQYKQYNEVQKEQLRSSAQNLYTPEALWIYGYTATYSHNGTTQQHLYNEAFSGVQYISDFTFLMDSSFNKNTFTETGEGTITEVKLDDNTKLTELATKIEDFLNDTNIQDFYTQLNALKTCVVDLQANITDTSKLNALKTKITDIKTRYENKIDNILDDAITSLSSLDDTQLTDADTLNEVLNVVEGFVVKYANTITKIAKATTNQAPVILSSNFYFPDYQSKIEGYCYQISGANTSIYKVNKDTRFIDPGKYYLIMKMPATGALTNNVYEEEVEGVTTEHLYNIYQLFAFEISSSPILPHIYATDKDSNQNYTLDTDNELQVNQYTNKNVYLTWATNSPFDHDVTVEWYFNSNYKNDNITYTPYTTTTSGKTTYTNLLKNQGFYRFKITSNKNTTGYYSFYIDKTPISGIAAYGIDGTTVDDVTVYTLDLSPDAMAQYTSAEQNTAITNNQFGWKWNFKDSGAPITAVRYFAPLSTSVDFNAQILDSINAITTNGVISGFGQAITYKATTRLETVENDDETYSIVTKLNNLTQSQILKNAGIYVLVLVDAAGNEATFVTILDNTSPTLLVKDAEGNITTERYFSNNASVYWQQYKAIEIQNILDNNALVVDTGITAPVDANMFKDNYLVIANKTLDILGSAGNDESTSQDQTLTINDKTVSASMVIDIESTEPTISLKYIKQDGTQNTIITLSLDDMAIYSFNLYDNLNNFSSKSLTFSLDQSGIQLYSFSNKNNVDLNEGNTDRIWVQNTFGTNRNLIAVKWQEPTNDGIVIDYIKLNYYPLLNDTDIKTISKNYPYAETPTVFYLYKLDGTTDVLYTPYPGTPMQYLSYMLNTTQLTELVSKEGKYEIIRKYTDAFNGSTNQNKDKQTRVFSFYVDRNTLISKNYAPYTLSYGYDANDYPDDYYGYGKTTSSTEDLVNAENEFNLKDFTAAKWLGITHVASGTKVSVSINNPYYYGFANALTGFKYLPTTDITSEQMQTIITQYRNSLTTTEEQTAFDALSNDQKLEKVYQYVLKTLNSLKTIIAVQHYNVDFKKSYTNYYSNTTLQNTKYKQLSQLEYAFNTPGSYRVIIYDTMNIDAPLTKDPTADINRLINGKNPNYLIFYFEISSNAPKGQFNSKTNIDSNYNQINTTSTINNVTVYNTNDDYVIFTFSDPTNAYDAKIAYKDVQISGEYTKFGQVVRKDTPSTLEFTDTHSLSSLNEIERVVVDSSTLYYYTNESNITTYYVVFPKEIIDTTYNAQLDCNYSITLHYIKTTNKNEFPESIYSSTYNIFIDHTAPYTNLYKLIENDVFLNQINEMYNGTISYIKQHIDDPTFDFLNHYVFTVNEDFFLTAYDSSDTDAARYKKYNTSVMGPYNGTTATVINSKSFYPTNSTSLEYYREYWKTGSGASVVEQNKYRPFKAGNYYDIIEKDNAGNYRVYTIYVAGKQDNKPNYTNTNVASQSNTNLLVSLNLLDSTTETTFALNGSSSVNIESAKTYSKLTYYADTIEDISSNISDELYWQIIKYTIATSKTSNITKTIIYFPSDDINTNREESNRIENIKEMLKLGNNSAVEFVTSKQDLLAKLNSIIINSYNENKDKSGSKITFEFMNKIAGNPYYSVTTRTNKDGSVVIVNKYVQFDPKNLDIVPKYALTINTRGIDIVNTANDFIDSTETNTFNLKIPASNISTYINKIILNGNRNLVEYDEATDTYSLNTIVFSLNQSYNFRFVDNFGVSKTFIYPVDSEYTQKLDFKDGSNLNVHEGSTYTFTCGDAVFTYDSNNLRYINILIEDLTTNEVLLKYSNYGDEAENIGEIEDYYTTSIGTDGNSKIAFITRAGVYYRYTIQVGSDLSTMTNPSTHIFILYTIFPTVTITDTNGANMIEPNKELITSKDLLISLIPNSQARFNPVVVLDNGRSQILVTAEFNILVDTNGTYKILMENEIGKYSLGTINFTRKTYDVSIYDVYYKNGENLTPLTKKLQGYKYDYTTTKVVKTTDSEGNEVEELVTIDTYRYVDRYFFVSPNTTGWNNITILLNENKQLHYEEILNDEYNNTKLYKVSTLDGSVYNIETYFAVTRIPSATTDIVSDFLINGNLPYNPPLHQIYPKKNDSSPLEAIVTWENSYKFNNRPEDATTDTNKYNDSIAGFYIVDLWLNGTYVGAYTNGEIRLYQSGTYTLKVHDILGQYKTFSQGLDYYTITIYRDVVFSVNGEHPIQNATFNNNVTISISNIAQYTNSNIEFTVMRNSASYDAQLTKGEFTFTEPGVYIVKMRGTLTSMGTDVGALYSEYRFTKISENEARPSYQFAKQSGYTITKIIKDGTELNITPLYTLALDANNTDVFGKGKYQITVTVKGEGLIPTLDYTYTIWINNEKAILNCTREWGTSSTDSFTISLNPSVVYTRIGNCYVKINNNVVMVINEENSTQNEVISYTNPKTPGVYVIQMYTESGDLISSQRLTIKEPLNTIAIVLIVLAAVVVIGLVMMFIIIRKRQKVK